MTTAGQNSGTQQGPCDSECETLCTEPAIAPMHVNANFRYTALLPVLLPSPSADLLFLLEKTAFGILPRAPALVPPLKSTFSQTKTVFEILPQPMLPPPLEDAK